MGHASKIASVAFRTLQLVSAAIVIGLIGDYLRYASSVKMVNSNIVYTEAIAGLSIFFSIFMIIPWKYFSYAAPLDFIMFIMWMVSFGLLRNLSGGSSCKSSWYWQNWGYFYGGYQYYPTSYNVTQDTVGRAGCSKMQSVLAFAFIGGWGWLLSGALGVYIISKGFNSRKLTTDAEHGDHHKSHAHEPKMEVTEAAGAPRVHPHLQTGL